MAVVTIVERGCRGCTLCVDTCPVDVFELDQAESLARVARPEDCIGCLSCDYVCPSGCIEVGDVEVLRPFHRISNHVALLERFLQVPPAAWVLTPEDLAEAEKDVAARLIALADAVVEIMGRGHKAVGRRAGAVAAAHMPEMYESAGLEQVLPALERQLGEAFALRFEGGDHGIDARFSPCGLCQVVTDAGQRPGEAVLCEIFHEYLAGLLTAYAGARVRHELLEAGSTCSLRLTTDGPEGA